VIRNDVESFAAHTVVKGSMESLGPVFLRSPSSSYWYCTVIQISAELPKYLASLFCVVPRSSMKSSIRISPGWIGSIRTASVVVEELDIFRTSIAPHEAEPPLRVHTAAVLPAPIAD